MRPGLKRGGGWVGCLSSRQQWRAQRPPWSCLLFCFGCSLRGLTDACLHPNPHYACLLTLRLALAISIPRSCTHTPHRSAAFSLPPSHAPPHLPLHTPPPRTHLLMPASPFPPHCHTHIPASPPPPPCPLSLIFSSPPPGSITVPSLASVYNEFALKKHMDTSVLLQVCDGSASVGGGWAGGWVSVWWLGGWRQWLGG